MKWQEGHGKVIKDFLSYLNEKTDLFVLKGGTALAQCYNLDRFSEDIDLDGTQKGIHEVVQQFCEQQGCKYRTAKDTDTVQRYMIDYGGNNKPLKVETSYRRKAVPPNEVTEINGIKVYNINSLCVMKCGAYYGRDRIRDLFDLAFITNNYYDQLDPSTRLMVQNALETKGIEQFDYLVQTQSDELIDVDTLAASFLNMYDKMGLLRDKKDDAPASLSTEAKDARAASQELNDGMDHTPQVPEK